jgi:hypothetical protein
LIEKIETSVTSLRSDSERNAPNTASPPMNSGSDAATSPPKTTTRKSRVRGTAIDSALARSDSMVVPTSWKTASWPPTATSSPSWSPS